MTSDPPPWCPPLTPLDLSLSLSLSLCVCAPRPANATPWQEVDGLKRKLVSKLSPESESLQVEWEIGECVGSFYRPNFEQVVYPYLPAHITRPKETKKVYMVRLPESCYFAVPSNLKLLAVPLFELYDNAARYGPIIAGLPLMLSKFQFVRA